MEQILLRFASERRVLTVSEVNSAIRNLFEEHFQDVWVAGEIFGVRQAASGHFYFTLKDEVSQLRCACFRSSARFLKFKPQDGMAVIARGRIDVYEVRGEYQLLVETLEPQGFGALQVAFEQLKKKLEAEGLFDPARKRPIPRFPGHIGIVTSPQGAVIHDMVRILSRRFPGLHMRLYPALVQGEGALEEICAGVGYFASSGWADVIVVARGGGSLEDLWTFNEERLARAIAASPTPVISAVGHETDFTIADFVADLRAPTPSAAAELLICTRQELFDQIAARESALTQAIRYRLTDAARRLHQLGVDRATSSFRRSFGRYLQRVDEFEYAMRDSVRTKLETARRAARDLEARLRHLDLRLRLSESRRKLETAERQAVQALRMRLMRSRGLLEPLSAQLMQLSPLRILERGYAIVEDEAGHIVKNAADVALEAQVAIRIARGRLKAKVTGIIPPDSSGLPS